MFLRIFFIFLFLNIQFGDPEREVELLEKYKNALTYYNLKDPTAETDSLALTFLRQVLDDPNRSLLGSEILLDAHEKVGNLYLINNDFGEAIVYYRRGLEFDYKEDFSDTLFFASNLFLGESYYQLSKADSSIYFLENAEKLLNKKESKLESARLHNSLGVIYYESGNYSQSINYFNQARSLSVGNKDYKDLDEFFQHAEFSFLNNIGSSLMGLGELDSALSIYRKVLSFGINRDRTLSQIAEVYLKKSEPDSALHHLDLIQSDRIKNSISYQNQLAEVFFFKNEDKKAVKILDGLVQNYGDKNNRNFQLGITHINLGKIALKNQRFEEAARFFHQGILEIDGVFENDNIFENPSSFSLGFATFQLFESVSGKAKSLMELYYKTDDQIYKDAALSTYQTAFDISFLVSNYYDNDEARIFLADYVLETYEDAIGNLYGLYVRSGKHGDLDLLFEWVEKSKATSLNLRLKEKKVKRNIEIPADWIQKERDLQFSISRLQQRINANDQNEQIDLLTLELRNKRLELSRLMDQFNDIPEYMEAKLAEEDFDIKKIQKEVLDKNSAILSFFETGELILVFLLDKSDLKAYRVEKTKDLMSDLQSFKFDLKNFQPGIRYAKGGLGLRLNQQLFSKLHTPLSQFNKLIFIPHGVLMDLPFATFEDEKGNYWVEKFGISYQYSLEFLNQPKKPQNGKGLNLAFAPFSSKSWSEDGMSLSQLPNSLEEIGAVFGLNYSDEEATKEMFLKKAGEAHIIHLATHALPDARDPSQSFIAFYPGNISNRLFTHEIYNLDLDNLSLVFLSACETNSGIVSQSEGVLSISRAFSYAGCPNVITTLWKAEDMATAYLSDRFYFHIEKGSGYSEALRLAQLDFLGDRKMSQFHHPSFWAHLIYIGDSQPENTQVPFYVTAIILLLFLLLFVVYYKIKIHPQRNGFTI